jgi:hypothetical protein
MPLKSRNETFPRARTALAASPTSDEGNVLLELATKGHWLIEVWADGCPSLPKRKKL